VRRHLGNEVTLADAERAFRAEMTYYADHCHEGSDARTLAALRERCAAIVLEELGIAADPALAATLLSDAIAFRAYADAAPLLAGLAGAGVGVAVVSNWDCSLPDALAAAGIAIERVVASGSTGSSKPDPAIFEAALDALGVPPGRALHVGDTEETDGVGARAAGIDVRIVDRGGGAGGADTISALTDVLDLL
jgi:putative hydrolase of the HAD superfamily